MANQLNFNQLLSLVKLDLASGNTPALLGEPGIGKSSFFEGLARELQTKVFTLPVNQLADRADLTGARILEVEHNGEKQWEQAFFPHATIMQSIRYALDHPKEKPILFLDEINRASSDITSSILAFITLRRIGTIDFPPNLQFAIAGNDKGNVVSLDGASLSRFSIYRVVPDVQTFLTVQKVNPFIQDVLQKHPNLLMCDPVESVSLVSNDDDEDDDNDSDILEAFSLEGSDFSQITRPRTISRLSQWLDEAGINKSGSDKEKEQLNALFSQVTAKEDGGTNLMMISIESKVGYTEFAIELHETIQEYYSNLINSNGTSSLQQMRYTDVLRPHQDTINTLARAQSSDEISNLIDGLNYEERGNTLLWLFESSSVAEVNNTAATTSFVSMVSDSIADLSAQQAKVFTALLSNADALDNKNLDAFRSSQSGALAVWDQMIEMLLGD